METIANLKTQLESLTNALDAITDKMAQDNIDPIVKKAFAERYDAMKSQKSFLETKIAELEPTKTLV